MRRFVNKVAVVSGLSLNLVVTNTISYKEPRSIFDCDHYVKDLTKKWIIIHFMFRFWQCLTVSAWVMWICGNDYYLFIFNFSLWYTKHRVEFRRSMRIFLLLRYFYVYILYLYLLVKKYTFSLLCILLTYLWRKTSDNWLLSNYYYSFYL